MKIKVSEAKEKTLDYLVSLCEGATNLRYDTVATWWVDLNGEPKALSSGWGKSQSWHPSTNWSQGGPIIEREKIALAPDIHHTKWSATLRGEAYIYWAQTPLIAAMRCYVASKLGLEVDVPNELI
jgi:hypothetical protein